MELQKVSVKFFTRSPAEVSLTDFIDIFNSWIQSSEGDFYDLADYSHMHAGPGILLITDGANISIDETGGRRGLLYNFKRPLQGPNGRRLREVFKAALEYCQRIENEPPLKGRIRFLGDEALFVINDRFLAPNTEESFRVVKPDLQDLARALYAGAEFNLEPSAKDRRERFGVKIRTPVSFDIETLLKNLEERELEVGKSAIT